MGEINLAHAARTQSRHQSIGVHGTAAQVFPSCIEKHHGRRFQECPDPVGGGQQVRCQVVGRRGAELSAHLAPLSRSASPFADEVPRVDARGTHWVEPVLVVDVDTHGAGYSRLRQPSFRGVRGDLTPDDLPGQS